MSIEFEGTILGHIRSVVQNGTNVKENGINCLKFFPFFSWFKHEYRIFLISFELNFVRCVLQILWKRKRNTIDYNSILS